MERQGTLLWCIGQRVQQRNTSRLSDLFTGGRVLLANGQQVEYDWLVLALGATGSTFGIAGVKELAVPFCTYEDAMKVGHLAFGFNFAPTQQYPDAKGVGSACLHLRRRPDGRVWWDDTHPLYRICATGLAAPSQHETSGNASPCETTDFPAFSWSSLQKMR